MLDEKSIVQMAFEYTTKKGPDDLLIVFEVGQLIEFARAIEDMTRRRFVVVVPGSEATRT